MRWEEWESCASLFQICGPDPVIRPTEGYVITNIVVCIFSVTGGLAKCIAVIDDRSSK